MISVLEHVRKPALIYQDQYSECTEGNRVYEINECQNAFCAFISAAAGVDSEYEDEAGDTERNDDRNEDCIIDRFDVIINNCSEDENGQCHADCAYCESCEASSSAALCAGHFFF